MNDGFQRMEFPKGLKIAIEHFQPLELEVGTGNYSRISLFAKSTIAQDNSIVAFDHSGHGQSTGQLQLSSLKKRVQETVAVIDTFTDRNPRAVCGSSMGGHVAIKLI